MDSVEHSLRRDNQRLRAVLADMGNQRDRAISSAAQEKKEAKRLRAEIERITALLNEAHGEIRAAALQLEAEGYDTVVERLNKSASRIKEPRNDQ